MHPTEGLRRGPLELHVTPKSLAVLAFLVAHRGKVIAKDELIAAIWRDVAVSDSALTSCIKELRHALDDDAKCPTFIETLHRRGYRFIAAVTSAGHPRTEHVAPGAALPPSPLFQTTAASGFVGRERELAVMREVWTRAAAGRRQLILVGGEPGIGKTRLASEFARVRAKSGETVLVGRCDEEALVPYQPFVEALSWYARVCPETELRSQLAAIGGGGELGQLSPELVRRFPGLPAPPPMNPEGQRYRLFQAVAELLARATSTRPTALVLEDLHWADKPTLLLLRHVVRASGNASLCIVGTYRESELGRAHPLTDLLADLRREPVVARLSLCGLGDAHVKALIDSIIGSDVSSQLARFVTDSTDGNPFFIGEMLRHLTETGVLADFQAARAPVATVAALVPDGIKEVIRQRVSRLSEGCNRTLSLAAVIGREFQIDVLEALGDVSEAPLLGAIDEAVDARLIAEVPYQVGRFSFVHALIRETLYSELTTTRRARLHRRVGETIEGLFQGHSEPPLADLAYHFVQAASADTADKAIDYATRAGDRAADMLAQEEAARFYEMALQSLDSKGEEPDSRRLQCELHARRGRAFGALAQWALQKVEIERALEYLDPALIERRCELVAQMVSALFFLLDIRSVERLAPELLALAEQVNRSDLAATAIAFLGRGRSASGDLAASIELDRAAIARAQGGRTIAHAMEPLSHYLMASTNEGLPLGFRAAEMARSSHDTTFTMNALSHLGLNLGSAGRYVEAENVFDEARRFGQKYGVLPLVARAVSMSAGWHLNVFDVAGAEALALEARELGLSAGYAPSIVSSGIDLLLIYARRHEVGAAQALMPETVAAVATTPGWHEWLWRLRLCQVRAELALARGAYTTAVTEADEGIRESQIKKRPKYEVLGLTTRARALHGLGRTAQAIADARQATVIARRTNDPALLLLAVDTLLALDGDDESAANARALDVAISSALPSDVIPHFAKSAVVQRVRHA